MVEYKTNLVARDFVRSQRDQLAASFSKTRVIHLKHLKVEQVG
jgi:hypothetical protein